jgi:hypothetical protein
MVRVTLLDAASMVPRAICVSGVAVTVTPTTSAFEAVEANAKVDPVVATVYEPVKSTSPLAATAVV